MGTQISESEFNFDVLPVFITEPVLLGKYTEIIRLWGREESKDPIYEGEISNIIVRGSFLSFSCDGMTGMCSVEPPEYNTACTDSIKKALYRNMAEVPENVASILC